MLDPKQQGTTTDAGRLANGKIGKTIGKVMGTPRL
jgi:hypothetical protein